jgi:hypothetical protein
LSICTVSCFQRRAMCSILYALMHSTVRLIRKASCKARINITTKSRVSHVFCH